MAAASDPPGGDDLPRDRGDVGGLAVERERAGVGEGQRPEVVEEAGHHRRLGEQRRDVVLVDRVDAVDHGLEAALDDRERRPQLVGDVGEHRATVVARPVESLGHRVERAREAADGPRAAGLHPDAGLAVGEAIGRVGDLRERPHGRAEDAGRRAARRAR